MMQPVGILGGTFDPFHHGHLRLAIECREKLQLQSLLLVPLNHPPHRETPLASASHRLAMLKLAVDKYTFLQVDECELQRDDVSYSIDTVKHIRQQTGTEPLCLLLGKDAFNGLSSWKDWQQLVDYTHIVVVERPGSRPGVTDTALSGFVEKHLSHNLDDLRKTGHGKLFELETPLLDISASDIRSKIQAGRDLSGLLPERVIDYINKHSLYQQDNA